MSSFSKSKTPFSEDIARRIVVTHVDDKALASHSATAQFVSIGVYHRREMSIGDAQVVFGHGTRRQICDGRDVFLHIFLVFVKPSVSAVDDGSVAPTHILSVVVLAVGISLPLLRRMIVLDFCHEAPMCKQTWKKELGCI